MRLDALNPCWITSPASPNRPGVGVSFLCPRCRAGTISCYFLNPLDGGKKVDYPPQPTYWTRAGFTFETLTLTPGICSCSACRWHGYLTGGFVV